MITRARGAHRLLPVAALAAVVVLLASVAWNASAASVPPPTFHLLDWPNGTPNDPMYPLETTYLDAIHVPQAWMTTQGSPSVTVAVLDSGVDAASPDVSSQLVNGYDAVANAAIPAASWTDVNGHGTFVSSVIAAATNNGLLMAGIAPRVRIMPVRVVDSSGAGEFPNLISGLDWAVAHGANIVNMSLGGQLTPNEVAEIQPDFTAAINAGVVIVAAAGNDGTTETDYPCGFAGVICVGATNTAGTAISSFSNRSPAVDVVAPGEDIIGLGLSPDSTYYNDGTSFSTAIVSGVVAMVRSVAPTATPAQVLSILVSSATPMSTGDRLVNAAAGVVLAGSLASNTVAPSSSASPSSSPLASLGASPAAGGDVAPPTSPAPVPSPTPPAASAPAPARTITRTIIGAISAATPRVYATVSLGSGTVSVVLTRSSGTASFTIWLTNPRTHRIVASGHWHGHTATLTTTVTRGVWMIEVVQTSRSGFATFRGTLRASV